MNQIIISVGEITLQAELNDSLTAHQIWSALPIEGKANRWGDEVYFEIPVRAALEPGARAEVEVGELGYWPTGNALCIFFGPTPASTDEHPRAASPVTIVGRILDDATRLRSVKQGAAVRVVAA